jgi:hypothetical protein
VVGSFFNKKLKENAIRPLGAMRQMGQMGIYILAQPITPIGRIGPTGPIFNANLHRGIVFDTYG